MNVVLYRLSLRCLALGFAGLSSCQLLWSPNTPKNYVLPRPKKMILDKKLNEISGLYYLTDEKAMLAIADDKQKIYRITPDGKESDYFEAELGTGEDFEDVTKVGTSVYVLSSKGTIVEVSPTDSGFQVNKYPFGATGKNDFETLYYDPAAKGLIMVCKSCANEKGKDLQAAYRFDLAGKQFEAQPYYTISGKDVRNSLKDGKVEFKPSAAAIHPIEKRLYILSSAGNLMVITSLKGVVENVYRLNPTLYPQAEGIAFASNGDMYVSNEAKLGKPTLLYIPYKPSGTK